MKYANVIVDISNEKLDKIFQYIIPAHLQPEIRAGVQVMIPFGKGNRTIAGYVLEVTDQAQYEPSKMKEIQTVRKGSIPMEAQLIALAAWMKEHTGSTLQQALRTVLPIKRKIRDVEKVFLSLAVDREEAEQQAEYYAKRKNTKGRAILLQALLQQPQIEKSAAVGGLGISEAVIQGMEKSGLICRSTDKIYRTPQILSQGEETHFRIQLNHEQRQVVEEILSVVEQGDATPHLIYGVTGSGKTEVYMELMEAVLAKGRQVIVLIPEISLTYQAVMRYYQRFGEQVSVVNSRLSQGEKYDQFERAKKGLVNIMIGPRSALFTPFSNLGMIIIDEEQEGAYKSEAVPRYHAVDTAIARAALAGAFVVLGTATPSITSYYRAMTGRYHLHKMMQRAKAEQLAAVTVKDMREELKQGNKTIFSRELDEKIRERLEHHQQVILFMNRRGYANFLSCRSCGTARKCPHCDVTLKYHKNGTLKCHYCGYEITAPHHCPECGSPFIAPFGAGTQKVEEEVKKRYPNARVLRMDMDTTKGKEDHNHLIEAFARQEADILIGTQMIVKGHDFPMVTLVGILAADLSLYASDYTAAEKTFQLLTQAAGRAGRGKLPGEVIIQTYRPEEYSIVAASHQDYEEFYQKEWNYRKMMKYPPAAGLMTVQVAGRQEEAAKICADILQRSAVEYNPEVAIMGPSRAGVYRINDIYRYMIYLKGGEELLHIQSRMEQVIRDREEFKNIMIQYDFENI